MKRRIRNILLETLILESPMFKAVAVKYNGKVYAGTPFSIHASICDQITDEIGQEYRDDVIENAIAGYITLDGKFVNRREAGELLHGHPQEMESTALRVAGGMKGIKGGIKAFR